MTPDALKDFLASMPHVAQRTAAGGLWLLVVAGVLWNGGTVLGMLRARLEPSGLLPRALTVAQGATRLLALYVLVLASAGLFPQIAAWVVPLAFIGGAVALGFVLTQDMVPDFSAGLLLVIQQRVRRGQWIQGDGFLGTVDAVGFSTVWLRDPHGRTIMVPNRVLLRGIARTDPSPHPLVDLNLRLPAHLAPQQVRAALHEVVLSSPWLAPDPRIEILNDPLEPTTWRVRARVLQIEHEARFIQATTDGAQSVLVAVSA